MTFPSNLRAQIPRNMKNLCDRRDLSLCSAILSPPEQPDPVRVTFVISSVNPPNPPDPPDPPDSDGPLLLLWINPSIVALTVTTFRFTPPIYTFAPLSVNTRKISSLSAYNVRFSNFLKSTVGVNGQFSCTASLTDLRMSLLSSLKVYSFTSSVEKKRKITFHCTSYHHSSGSKPIRVSYLSYSQPPSLVLDVCETNIGVLLRLISYSPMILLLNVYDIILVLLLGLCVYSPLTLFLDVYNTLLRLVSDSFRKVSSRRCSDHVSPLIRSLFPCSPLHKMDPNLLRIDYMFSSWLNCILACRKPHLLIITSSLGPISSSFVLWRIYRCRCVTRLALGWGDLSIDDPLSIVFKGLTLISAAEFKIVKPALDAATITDGSSLDVFSISHEVISMLRLNVVEIGLLYYVSRLCIMTFTILCLCAFVLLFVALNVVVFVNNSSFIGA